MNTTTIAQIVIEDKEVIVGGVGPVISTYVSKCFMPHDGTKKWHFRKNKSLVGNIILPGNFIKSFADSSADISWTKSNILISYLIIVTFCKCQDHFQKYSVLKSHDPELGYVSYKNFWPKYSSFSVIVLPRNKWKWFVSYEHQII